MADEKAGLRGGDIAGADVRLQRGAAGQPEKGGVAAVQKWEALEGGDGVMWLDCEHCGKRFFTPYAAELWAYRRVCGRTVHMFCSWRCFRAAHPPGKRSKGRVKMYDNM